VLDGYWEALQRGEGGDTGRWLSAHPEGSHGLVDLRLLTALHDAGRMFRGDSGEAVDRDDLWPLLVLLTARRVLGQASPEADTAPAPLPGPGANAEFVAQVAEECRRLLDLLGDGELRAVALWKMEGCANEEIAARLGRTPRAVGRKLRAIRTIWDKEGGS